LDAWITLPARLASIEAARQWLLRQLQGADLAPALLVRIELVLEELLMNLVRHGRARPGAAEGLSLRLGAEVQADHLMLCIEDDGVAFDPTLAPVPAAPQGLAQAQVGGWGLVLVRKSVRSLRYETAGGLNRLWVELPLRPAAA
jgi:sigma-B regulation protein RsbU (phosphoserine phosphatase)